MGIDLTPSSQAEEELEIFLREHQNEFYRLAYSYVKNADEALDVVQEAAIKAFVHRSSLRNPQNMKAWFYRILVNESLTWLRRNRRMYIQFPLIISKACKVKSAQNVSMKIWICIRRCFNWIPKCGQWFSSGFSRE